MNVEKWNILMGIMKGEGIDQTSEEFTKPFIEWMLPWIPPDKYPKLLDLGCGFGLEIKRFCDYGWKAIGIDHADGNIKHAKEHFGIEILKMDMHDLQFPPASFDAVLTKQVFEHSYAPWLLASEIWIVLRPGGRWIIDLPSPQNKDMWTMWHANLLYFRQVRFIFEKVGFKIIHADESAGVSLDFNGGGGLYRYVVEKIKGYPDNYQHVLRALEGYHQRTHKPPSFPARRIHIVPAGDIKVTACVLTLNEEDLIEDCLLHLKPYVDYLLVLDGCSSDKTATIANRLADRVIVRAFKGSFAKERNHMQKKAPSNWVLHCDADERFPKAFLKNMKNIIRGSNVKCFRFPRSNLDQTYPHISDLKDHQVRLLDKRFGVWKRPVHEIVWSPTLNKPLDQCGDRVVKSIDYPIIHLIREKQRRTAILERWKTLSI